MSKKATSKKAVRPAKRKRQRDPDSESVDSRLDPQSAEPHSSYAVSEIPYGVWLAAVLLSLAAFAWAYLPVFESLIARWNDVADYSHGYLVVPITLYFLWSSRERVASSTRKLWWPGLALILIAAALRAAGSYYYLEALQGWSIPIWMAGFIGLFWGWKHFLWCLAPVGFLFFMVPLPYTLEIMLSSPLQKLSTSMSLVVMQCLGMPAVSEGTTIVLNEHKLEIERACSGLRIFFGIAALAYAFLLLDKRPMRIQLLLVLAVIPITLVANTTRIVATAILFQMGWSDTANHLSHDFAGLFMIPFALLLFILTLRYLDSLFPTVETYDFKSLIEQQASSASPSTS